MVRHNTFYAATTSDIEQQQKLNNAETAMNNQNNLLFNEKYELTYFNYMQMTSHLLCCCFVRLKKLFKFKSIEDIWLCLFIMAFNCYLVYENFFNGRRFFSLANSSANSTHHTEPDKQTRLYIVFILAINCFLLWPFYIFSSLFKCGILANDNYKFGKDLNLRAELKDDDELLQSYRDHYRTISAASDERRLFEQQFNKKKRKMENRKLQLVWQYYLPPISCILHIFMAMSVLYSNLMIRGNEISKGLVPKSNLSFRCILFSLCSIFFNRFFLLIRLHLS